MELDARDDPLNHGKGVKEIVDTCWLLGEKGLWPLEIALLRHQGADGVGGVGVNGDTCADALVVGLGANAFDSTGNTDSGFHDPSCVSRDGFEDIWFTYTAAASGNTTFETCGSAYDTVIRVLEGPDCATLTCLAGNDDACGLASQVEVPVVVELARRVARLVVQREVRRD